MFTNYLCLHTVDFKISQNSLKCPYLGAEEMGWWLRALASLAHGLGLVTSPTWQFTTIYKSSYEKSNSLF